jgi:hypothetical protein
MINREKFKDITAAANKKFGNILSR